MPNDKPPSVSFNMWLSIQSDGPYAELSSRWRTTRGRLTRATVVSRAMQLGVFPATAASAYDEYCHAVGLPVTPTST